MRSESPTSVKEDLSSGKVVTPTTSDITLVAAFEPPRIKYRLDHVTVGIHAHNDCGSMGVANSMMATKVGAGLVQGTTTCQWDWTTNGQR
jgi:hypothetical protein